MRNVEEAEPTRRTRLTAAQRRESILDAAVEVFSAVGYRAGKVSDVAALVGVSEPVIFQNFGSKAALFAAVVDRMAHDVRAELDRLARRPGSASDLLAHALGPAGHQLLRAPGSHALESHALESHAHGPHALGAHGILFADAFALIAEPEITEPARRAARTIADHLADLIRRGQATCTFAVGVAQDLGWPDHSFDVVTCTLAVHHIPEAVRADAFGEMYRVTRPGGRLLVADLRPSRWHRGPHGMRHTDAALLGGLAEAAGYHIEATGDLPMLRYVRAVRPASHDDANVVP